MKRRKTGKEVVTGNEGVWNTELGEWTEILLLRLFLHLVKLFQFRAVFGFHSFHHLVDKFHILAKLEAK